MFPICKNKQNERMNYKISEKKWILMPSNLIPETLEPLLIRSGFEKNSFGYMAEI